MTKAFGLGQALGEKPPVAAGPVVGRETKPEKALLDGILAGKTDPFDIEKVSP